MQLAAHKYPPSHRWRAAAEIELLLVIPILLTILFIIGAMLVLGPARVLNVFKSNELAYRDATATSDPQLSGSSELDPINDAMSAAFPPALPLLPSRVHVSDLATPVALHVADALLKKDTVAYRAASLNSTSVTLANKSAFISPPWAYSNYPAMGDAAMVAQWTQAYADESLESIETPLHLSPAWPP